VVLVKGETMAVQVVVRLPLLAVPVQRAGSRVSPW
jgi:hypothetical protein